MKVSHRQKRKNRGHALEDPGRCPSSHASQSSPSIALTDHQRPRILQLELELEYLSTDIANGIGMVMVIGVDVCADGEATVDTPRQHCQLQLDLCSDSNT